MATPADWFAISVAALPVCRFLMSDRGDQLIEALARRLAWPGASLAFVAPIYLLMGIGAALGTETHDWFEFAWYLGYFLIGFLVLSDDRFMGAVRRDLWPAVAVAMVSTALIVAGIPAPLETVRDQEDALVFLAMVFLFAAEGWAWTLVVLNVGMRLRRLQRPVSEQVGDAVLPLYVIHQPVILVVAFFVVQWPLAILPKWLIVLGISLPTTLLLVALALRTPVTRILVGARVRAAQPVVVVPASVSLGQSPAVPPPASVHHG